MTDAQLADSQSVLLDLLRYGLAAVVVIGHGLGFFLGYFDGFFPKVFPHPQSIAVVCFFYLSGFLIVGSQIRKTAKEENSLRKYLFDRATRVYVTLLPCLVFVVVVDLFFKQLSSVDVDLVASYTSVKILVKNALLIPSMPYGTMRPIWSLMYEWWIYLLFGGVYFFKSNRVAASVLILAGAYYTLDVNAGGEAGHIWLIWAVGGGCAYLRGRINWNQLNGSLLNVLALALVLMSGVFYFLSKDAYNLPAGILLALAIFLVTCKPSSFLAKLPPFRAAAGKLAGFSFSLFLSHYTVLVYTKEYLLLNGWAGVVISFLLSNLIAFSIAYFTEYKLARIKALLSKGVH